MGGFSWFLGDDLSYKDWVRKDGEADLVRFSRAGDAFHYRWAARRCLRMIDPLSSIASIYVEASHESELSGECAIDIAEYSETEDGEHFAVRYVQLKHSSVRTEKPMGFADISRTLGGFAERYTDLKKKSESSTSAFLFDLVTNRLLSSRLRADLASLREGKPVSVATRKRFEKVTGLEGTSLNDFLRLVDVIDGEGDYVVQREKLHGELGEYLAGLVDSDEVDRLIDLVTQRALPHEGLHRVKGEITREDVLRKIRVSSESDLFPAPRQLESLAKIIRREQHDELMELIWNASAPVMIHAPGGVGKSVVAQQIADALPLGSVGLTYDCFGAGGYRNPSEPRHRAADALIQIANELAAAGYCRPLIGDSRLPEDVLFRGLRERLGQTVRSLREINSTATLVLLIDAADNAAMVAGERNEPCFAEGLLRERLPDGVRLVVMCRTERRDLLKPKRSIIQFALKPFSEEETARHVRGVFSEASDDDVREFHRLSGGNPRVQANALVDEFPSASAMLENFGPAKATVEAQIQTQLESAVDAIKDRDTSEIARQVDAICLGLANLSPFVPVTVLARAAEVDETAVLSFVSDLGRPLWHSDHSVMFRDEPTETWFRETFAATPDQIGRFVAILEPLAPDSPYVAKALPELLLKSAEHDRLVALALSDELLPDSHPIDARNIRVYRLRFAFRAALKLGRKADAARLAFRAGEEVAGDQRQLSLLRENVDLAGPLLDPTRVQELAYRQMLRGHWPGSENVFSASVLSSVPDFRGDARGYLRAADRWMQVCLDEQARRSEHDENREGLTADDLAEMAWPVLNLQGPEAVVDFMLGWKPPDLAFRMGRRVVRRLIDAAGFEEIDKIAICGRTESASHPCDRGGVDRCLPIPSARESDLDAQKVGAKANRGRKRWLTSEHERFHRHLVLRSLCCPWSTGRVDLRRSRSPF